MILIFTFASESDRDKFDYLYAQYKNLLMHKALGILRDYMLAEDAVSEAYIRVYRNLHKIEDPASNSTISFLVTIVKNVALTMLQKTGVVMDSAEVERADDYDLETEVLDGLSAERVFGLLHELEEPLRAVFVLKYARDLPHREIAALLGTTENNVTVRLHRARRKLAAILVREGYAHEIK